MDDGLKKRLIGATVLVSLAVIFVPMLLQHEPLLDQGIEDSKIPPRPQRDYGDDLVPGEDEDLSRPLEGTVRIDPGERLPFMEPLAPPKEITARPELPPQPKAAPKPQTKPKPQKKPASKTGGQAKPAPPVVRQQVRSAAPARVSRGWVVQLGSFSQRANADKLVRRLKQKGFAATMASATVKGKRVYRVWVGPERERAKAERLLARVNREVRSLKLQGKLRSYP